MRRFLLNGPSRSEGQWVLLSHSQAHSRNSHLRGEGWSTGPCWCWGGEEGARPCTADSDMLCLFSDNNEILPRRARGWVRPSMGLCMSVGRRAWNLALGVEECWREGQDGGGYHPWPPAAFALPHAGSARMAGINTDTPIGLRMSSAARTPPGTPGLLPIGTATLYAGRSRLPKQESVGHFFLFF